MSSEPLAESLYGLGHMVRLYADHVDVNGRVYDLARLTNVRPHYHRLFGVPSARVELHFAERKIKLRGMPDIEEAARIVAHLNRCIRARVSPESGCAGGHIASPPYISSSPPLTQCGWLSPDDEVDPNSIEPPLDMQAVAEVGEVPRWMSRYQEQRERRQKRRQLERVRHAYGFDITQTFQRLDAKQLPVITLPISLLPGEEAHYMTDAMLCGQERPFASTKRYVPSDQGRLVLTSERLLYLGRKSQIVLAYAQLLHVSRLYDAIAFTAEHWPRPEVFAVRYPLECAMYLERILEQWQRRQEEQGESASSAFKHTMSSLEQDLARLPDAETLATIVRPQVEKRAKASFKDHKEP